MAYLVIDLEMCNVPRYFRCKAYHYANEAIQIGAVLLDEEFKRIGTLNQYVHPEYGVVDSFIENLTGIQNSQLKKAPKLQEALLHMIDWIGERDYKIFAWSNSDRDQILHEVKAKKMDDAQIQLFLEESKWIDYQNVFTKRFSLSRQYSLQEALARTRIVPQGRFHDGLDDAVNTGCLIEKLELNPDLQLIECETPEKELVQGRLSFKLGDVFSKLELQPA